jgi:hypothetical protein
MVADFDSLPATERSGGRSSNSFFEALERTAEGMPAKKFRKHLLGEKGKKTALPRHCED